MTWRRNQDKAERIAKYGQTVDLPLFEGKFKPVIKLPDWIYNGTRIKAEVFDRLKDKFRRDSVEYLQAVIELGGNATDNEVVDHFNDKNRWPNSTVSARRNYWTEHPYYIIETFPEAKKTGPRGQKNTIWYVNFKNLYQLINEV